MKLLFVTLSVLSSFAFSAQKRSVENTNLQQTEVILPETISNQHTSSSATAMLSTSINSLVSGNYNLTANLFFVNQGSFNIGFSNFSEQTKPLRPDLYADGTKLNVTKNSVSLGGAFFINPIQEKGNLLINPFLVFERKSDLQHVDNNSGFGLKVEGLYRMNSFAMSGGLQSKIVSNETTTDVLIGAGVIF